MQAKVNTQEISDSAAVKKTDNTIRMSFCSLLPVQIATVGITAVNNLIVTILIGRYLGETAIAAQGYVNPLVLAERVLLIFGIGAQIYSGQMLGRGNRDGIKRAFSTSVFFSILAGIILGVIAFAFPDVLSLTLGVRINVIMSSMSYLKGHAIGIAPMLLFQCFLSFLILECERKLSIIAIIVNVISNILLNIINIFALKQGMFGAGLATSFSYILAVLVCLPHFLFKSELFRFSFDKIKLSVLKSIIILGAPTAVISLCESLRNSILNNAVSSALGVAGMAAFTVALNVSCNIGDPLQQGHSVTTSIISSVLYGERDVEAIRNLPKTTVSVLAPVSVSIFVLIFIFAKPIADIFGANPASMDLYVRFIRVWSVWMVTDLLFNPVLAIYQTIGKSTLTAVFNILNSIGFIAVISIVAKLLSIEDPIDAFAILPGVLMIIGIAAYYTVKHGKLPHSPLKMVYVPNDFSVSAENRLSLEIHDAAEAMEASKAATAFCKSKNLSEKNSYFTGLCIEEAVMNTLMYNRHEESKIQRTIDVVLIYDKDGINIMIRDNYPRMNPIDLLKNFESEEDTTKGLGIKIITGLAKNVDYTSALNMNVLTISGLN